MHIAALQHAPCAVSSGKTPLLDCTVRMGSSGIFPQLDCWEKLGLGIALWDGTMVN